MSANQTWANFVNSEFLSFTANFMHAILWIVLIYLLTSATKEAFFKIVQIDVFVFVIHTIYIFNKDTTMSRIYTKTVVEQVEKIKIEQTATEIGGSFWSAMSWGYSKVFWSK